MAIDPSDPNEMKWRLRQDGRCLSCNKSIETRFNDFCYNCWYDHATHTQYGKRRNIVEKTIMHITDELWEGTIETSYKEIKDCILIRHEEDDDDGLTPEERKAMLHLVEVWNNFVKLPIQHNDDISEFRHGIHRLQHLLMIRPTRRNYKAYTNELRDGDGK